MRKISLLFLLCALLTACSSFPTQTAQQRKDPQGKNIQSLEGTPQRDGSSVQENITFEKEDYILWVKSQRIELVDPMTNSPIASTDIIGENETIFTTCLWEKGYAVLLLDSIPEESFRLLLLDESMALVQEYDLNSLLGEDVQMLGISIQSSALSADGSQFIYITPFGIFRCDLSQGQITEIEAEISFSSILSLGGSEIAYSASVPDQNAMEFGIFNWETAQVVVQQRVENYSGWRCSRSGNSIWWNDNADGYTGHSSGQLPILDLTTEMFRVLNVQDKESIYSCVSPDGSYVYASDFSPEKCNQKLNCYSVETGEVVWTSNFSLEQSVGLQTIRCSSQGDTLFLTCMDLSDALYPNEQVILFDLEGA